MWSLVLFTVVPFQPLETVGEVGIYTAFNQCVYAQHITQPKASSKDPNSFFLCIKNYKPTHGEKE